MEATVVNEFTRLIEAGVGQAAMQRALKRAHYLDDLSEVPMTEEHFYHEFDEAIAWSIMERVTEYQEATSQVASLSITALAADLGSMYRDYLEIDAITQCGRDAAPTEVIETSPRPAGQIPAAFSIIFDDMISAINYRVDHAQGVKLRSYCDEETTCRELVRKVVEVELTRELKAHRLTTCDPCANRASLAIKEVTLTCLKASGEHSYDTTAVIDLLTVYVKERAQRRLSLGENLCQRLSSLWKRR